MQERESRSTRSTIVFAAMFGMLGIALGLWATYPSAAAPEPEPIAQAPEQTIEPNAATAATTEQTERTVVVAPPTADVGRPPVVDFATAIAQICELAQRAATLASDDEIDAAAEVDKRVRTEFADLLAAFADAGDRSLAMLLDLREPDAMPPPEPAEKVRRTVLQMVLQHDLQRRHQQAEGIVDFTRSEELVQSTLDTMPTHLVVGDVGGDVLIDKPFLRLTHERSVLELVHLANDGEFSPRIATRLLMTLWDNLQRSGQRSSDEMSMLALLMLDETDPSQVIAACRRLLDDDRYRELVFARLRQRRDTEIATEVAQMAAHELPPRDALRVLRELEPVIEGARGLYLGIGLREPEVLEDAYRQHLAQNDQPSMRRELVMGIGMLPRGRGLQIAELAMQNDPSPDVRLQALFAVSVHGEPARIESAFSQLLDDPAIAGDQRHLAAVVLALQNLETGDANVVARLGARLKALPLADYSEDLLNEILTRCVPGGEVAGNGTSGG